MILAVENKTKQEVQIFCDGHWVQPRASQFAPVHNPSTGEIIAQTPLCCAREVDEVVKSAAAAFEKWSRIPATRRAGIMFRYRELLERNFEALSRLVTLENGKTLAEARGDVRRGIEVVEFACGIAHLTKGENIPRASDDLDGQTMREPLGVCAGITPFNFPAMVPMWMFPLAIACGNAFVLKPSEKVPLTACRLAELFSDAGLPPGVLNIVHGGTEAVDALCTHPKISAISFVGSSTVARHVYALGCEHGKRVQAAGGAKNVLVVMPDADPDFTLKAIMNSAFGCAGQRCMAGSLLMAVGGSGDSLRERLVHAMNRLKLGNTVDNVETEMGPVIDGKSQSRIKIEISQMSKQANLVRDGREHDLPGGFFVGPTLFDGVTPQHEIFKREVFGPVLAMLRSRSLCEAIEWTRQIRYGNGATIFTRDGQNAREFIGEMPCGMIGVNVGVPAPMALFAFSGWNESFYGDLHVQGAEGVLFYTRQKTVLSRWRDSRDVSRKLQTFF